MLFCLNLAHFLEIQLVCDGSTDGPTDGRTDTPSYRDTRTHLKKSKKLALGTCLLRRFGDSNPDRAKLVLTPLCLFAC